MPTVRARLRLRDRAAPGDLHALSRRGPARAQASHRRGHRPRGTAAGLNPLEAGSSTIGPYSERARCSRSPFPSPLNPEVGVRVKTVRLVWLTATAFLLAAAPAGAATPALANSRYQ